jgi:hypothetical protein
MKYFERKIITDVSEANEPLLQTLDSETYIYSYLIDFDKDNADTLALVKKMCVAARRLTEKFTGMSLAEQVIQIFFENEYVRENDSMVTLPFCPFSEMASVKTVTKEGTETELVLNTGYYLRGDLFKQIEFPETTSTSVVNDIDWDALDFRVRFTSGYGITGDNATETLPEELRTAMAKQVSEWWDNRSNYYPVLSERIKSLLRPYKRDAWYG